MHLVESNLAIPNNPYAATNDSTFQLDMYSNEWRTVGLGIHWDSTHHITLSPETGGLWEGDPSQHCGKTQVSTVGRGPKSALWEDPSQHCGKTQVSTVGGGPKSALWEDPSQHCGKGTQVSTVGRPKSVLGSTLSPSLARRLATRLRQPNSITISQIYGRLNLTLIRAKSRAILSRVIMPIGFFPWVPGALLVMRIPTCILTLSRSILLAGPPPTFIIAVRMVGATKVFPPPPNLVVCQQFRFQAQWGPPGMGQGLDPP
eukprot:Em0004g1730a